jgi:hypothetical protein
VNPCAHVGGWNRVGASCGGGSTETVRPAMGKDGGKGAPMVGRGRKVVEELQGTVRMLGVQTIEVGESRRQVFHGEQPAAAVEITGSSSGRRWGVLEYQMRGRGASWG